MTETKKWVIVNKSYRVCAQCGRNVHINVLRGKETYRWKKMRLSPFHDNIFKNGGSKPTTTK